MRGVPWCGEGIEILGVPVLDAERRVARLGGRAVGEDGAISPAQRVVPVLGVPAGGRNEVEAGSESRLVLPDHLAPNAELLLPARDRPATLRPFHQGELPAETVVPKPLLDPLLFPGPDSAPAPPPRGR